MRPCRWLFTSFCFSYAAQSYVLYDTKTKYHFIIMQRSVCLDSVLLGFEKKKLDFSFDFFFIFLTVSFSILWFVHFSIRFHIRIHNSHNPKIDKTFTLQLITYQFKIEVCESSVKLTFRTAISQLIVVWKLRKNVYSIYWRTITRNYRLCTEWNLYKFFVLCIQCFSECWLRRERSSRFWFCVLCHTDTVSLWVVAFLAHIYVLCEYDCSGNQDTCMLPNRCIQVIHNVCGIGL